jgi:antitoxin (DNA-binding transcriptional repressor) of toxin-antitoxin stability system
MIEATAENMAEHFAEFLAKVEQGETILIRDQGTIVARMVPDCDFMPGRQAAELFRGHRPDPEAANAIAAELQRGANPMQDHILARAGTWDGDISSMELLRRARP